jgi:hypothetical protein
MRFPSVAILAERARAVILRFPWTMAAGVAAAIFAVVGSSQHAQEQFWLRATATAALGLPLSVALTLFLEERGWAGAPKAALNLGAFLLLGLFFWTWPGPNQKYEVIRYFQLSAGLHLLVAILPFTGQRESNAFWQYNRHLFLGFLRALVFSMVLFVGLAVALLALNKLFGVKVPGELYARMYFVIIFVINTAIFLAAVPSRLAELASDPSYPRVLKVFSQYILTPLVFIYLVILLAYLVKIVLGGEWPSGWIGWLVTSVGVAGLLGFLLVHPLRDDPDEGWIRTYTRWLFIGLIPAAVVLLVAFWKRVLPYGMTELRLLGVLLGFWLLAMALSYTLKAESGIRRIPVTLAGVLLLTLYGPLSVTRWSVASQGRRLAALVAPAGKNGSASGKRDEREISAALRFLLEHKARRQIAAAIPGTLPPVNWDSAAVSGAAIDSAASQILAVANIRYEPRYSNNAGYWNVWAEPEAITPIAGYDWMVRVNLDGKTGVLIGKDTAGKAPFIFQRDTLEVAYDSVAAVLRLRAAGDSFAFELSSLARGLTGPSPARNTIPADRLRLPVTGHRRRAMLSLETISGRRSPADSLTVERWQGRLFFGRTD